MPSKSLSRSKSPRSKPAARNKAKRGRSTAAKAAAPRRRSTRRESSAAPAASMANLSPAHRRQLQKLGARWQALLPQLRRAAKSSRRPASTAGQRS